MAYTYSFQGTRFRTHQLLYRVQRESSERLGQFAGFGGFRALGLLGFFYGLRFRVLGLLGFFYGLRFRALGLQVVGFRSLGV